MTPPDSSLEEIAPAYRAIHERRDPPVPIGPIASQQEATILTWGNL